MVACDNQLLREFLLDYLHYHCSVLHSQVSDKCYIADNLHVDRCPVIMLLLSLSEEYKRSLCDYAECFKVKVASTNLHFEGVKLCLWAQSK